MNRDDHSDRTCSFCGNRQREVRKLIVGAEAHICDECTLICFDIISDEVLEPISGGQRLFAFTINATHLAYRADRFAFSCKRAVELPRTVAKRSRALADEIEQFASSQTRSAGSRAVLLEYALGFITMARHFASACAAIELPGHLAEGACTLADEIEDLFSPVSR